MTHINYFGIKNYRVFNNQEGLSIDLAPITLITGANNSGKSSILKALLMLRDSINDYKIPFDLDLTGNEHYLGDYQDFLHNETDNKLTISLPFPFLGINSLKLTLEFEFEKKKPYTGTLSQILIQENDLNGKTIMSFTYRKATKVEKKEYEDNYGDFHQSRLGHKFKAFIDFSSLSEYLNKFTKIYKVYAQKVNEFNKKRGIKQINYISTIQESSEETINAETANNIYSYLFKFIGKEAKLEQWSSFLTTLKYSKSDHHDDITSEDFLGDPEEPTMNEVFFNHVKSTLNRIKIENSKNQEKTAILTESFVSVWNAIFYKLTSINYTPSLRTITSRIYRLSDNTQFSKIIKEYSNNREDIPTWFINEWLEKLEIGYALDVKSYPKYNLSQVFIVIEKGKETEKPIKRLLIDFGYGIIQVVSILMLIGIQAAKSEEKYYNIGNPYEDSILLIEEPETNLHPKWQSKLAEMFVEAMNKLSVQFIIETHSVYLIRSFQNLVAKGKLDNRKIIIHYLRNKEKLKGNTPQISNIRIERDGSIEHNKFDTGFFNEEEKLQSLLLNINFMDEFKVQKKRNIENENKIKSLEEEKERNENKIALLEEKKGENENEIALLKRKKEENKEKIASLKAEKENKQRELNRTIDEYVRKHDIRIYKEAVDDFLGSNADKMSDFSKIYYASVKFMKATFGDDQEDYSPIVIQCGRIIETELFNFFVEIIVDNNNVTYPNVPPPSISWTSSQYTIDSYKVGVNKNETGASLKIHNVLNRHQNISRDVNEEYKEKIQCGNLAMWDAFALLFRNSPITSMSGNNIYPEIDSTLTDQFHNKSKILDKPFLKDLRDIIVQRNNAAHKERKITKDMAYSIVDCTERFITAWTLNMK